MRGRLLLAMGGAAALAARRALRAREDAPGGGTSDPGNAGAAEAQRRLDEARERLRAEVPEPDDAPEGKPAP